MTESDILFSEACLKLGARVRIMLREPITDETAQSLWPFADPECQKRFHELLQPSDRKEIWVYTIHLGTPPSGSAAQDPLEFVRRRHHQWLLNTARMEAKTQDIRQQERTSRGTIHDTIRGSYFWAGQPDIPRPGLYGLFLSDGYREG